jgi:hypothetical protein
MPSSFQVKLEGSTLDVSSARRAVVHLIGDESTVEFVRDAVVLTSELVTNAVVRAAGATVMRAEFLDSILRVELTDDCGVAPDLHTADAATDGATGLHVVSDVASRWGVTPSQSGKTIWFELDSCAGGR